MRSKIKPPLNTLILLNLLLELIYNQNKKFDWHIFETDKLLFFRQTIERKMLHFIMNENNFYKCYSNFALSQIKMC